MKDFIRNINSHNFVSILGMTLLISALLTEPSAAQDFSGMETFLEEIVDLITGPIGVAISALAVIAVGFSFMTGRMDWVFAASIVIGIAIVFGGATFVEGLSAS
ncbi:TrbC/VirB2 family protein [Notoacmeibacter sp. MSK16QG-6]|uniref:TrbC/VirB2 family protein n=1 Tax=Notoacmeibacter sp. MSK16QG-6 TaxID=2957982 RepID=UPI00209E4ABB|nr:TrbC/VirB2 family protein [Notoacmeibacter sp. MSK16QG-6]MCP1200597.1 TrbC/VirB2 family protein [Notoacmeibacter sp. MSK16QG-6]